METDNKTYKIFSTTAFFLLISSTIFATEIPQQSEDIASLDQLTGNFRLEKDTYIVAEPIIAIFEVTNKGNGPYSFSVGFNYRGWPPYDRNFSVTIKNDQGRDFTYPPTATFGGLGSTITLEPSGEKYRNYVLISSRAHILPPGNYIVEISRTLNADVFYMPPSGIDLGHITPVTFNGTMHFTVEPYDHEQLKDVLLGSYGPHQPKDREGFKMFSTKPITWALSDLSYKFDMGLSQGTDELQQKVIDLLPEKWDDSYYLEATLQDNRNWLTGSSPETYELTFRIMNNSNKRLLSGIFTSKLFLDGEPIQDWENILQNEVPAANAKSIEPGKTLEFTHRFNRYIKGAGKHNIQWKINNSIRERTVDVRGE